MRDIIKRLKLLKYTTAYQSAACAGRWDLKVHFEGKYDPLTQGAKQRGKMGLLKKKVTLFCKMRGSL